MKNSKLFWFSCWRTNFFRTISDRKKTVNLKYNFKFSNTADTVISKNVARTGNSKHDTDEEINKYNVDENISKHYIDAKVRKHERTLIVSDDLLKQSNRLRKEKMRKQLPIFSCRGEILYGVYPVYLSLLQNRRTFYEIFMKITSNPTEKHDIRNYIRKIGESLGIKITDVTSSALKQIAPDSVHQGVCMDVSSYPLLTFEEEEKTENVSPDAEFPIWLVLDEIQDPMNVGAILRSAYYFGINKIFITTDYSCKLTPTVSKASSGALEILDIYKIYDLVTFLKKQKELGWKVVSTTSYNSSLKKPVENTVNVNEFSVTKPTILILGNESQGSSLPVMNLCDHFVSIYPRKNLHIGIDSLNVSAATAILLHHLSKRP